MVTLKKGISYFKLQFRNRYQQLCWYRVSWNMTRRFLITFAIFISDARDFSAASEEKYWKLLIKDSGSYLPLQAFNFCLVFCYRYLFLILIVLLWIETFPSVSCQTTIWICKNSFWVSKSIHTRETWQAVHETKNLRTSDLKESTFPAKQCKGAHVLSRFGFEIEISRSGLVERDSVQRWNHFKETITLRTWTNQYLEKRSMECIELNVEK